MQYEYVAGGVRLAKYNGTDTQVIIPATLDDSDIPILGIGIGDSAPQRVFYRNNSLTRAEIYCADIGYGSFMHAENLTEVILGEGVTAIGEVAFYATAITEIVFPKTLTHVGNGAFRDVPLQSMRFLNPTPPTTLSGNPEFFRSRDVVVYVPDGAYDAYRDYFARWTFWEIEIIEVPCCDDYPWCECYLEGQCCRDYPYCECRLINHCCWDFPDCLCDGRCCFDFPDCYCDEIPCCWWYPNCDCWLLALF